MSSLSTVQALSTVIKYDTEFAITELRMENERLKKELEESREQRFVPNPAPGMGARPRMTWKEFSVELEARCEELEQKVDDAKEILFHNWHDARCDQLKRVIRETWDTLDPDRENPLDSDSESQDEME